MGWITRTRRIATPDSPEVTICEGMGAADPMLEKLPMDSRCFPETIDQAHVPGRIADFLRGPRAFPAVRSTRPPFPVVIKV